MDPAICIEAEQARLSERIAKAEEHVSECLRRLAEQREVVEELERHGRPAATAKRALVSLAATQRLAEDYYGHLLKQLNRALNADVN
jgi:ParB-like chromosome segregation protein Spo0J